MKHIFESPKSDLGHFVRLIENPSPPRDIRKRIVDTTLHVISHAMRHHHPQKIRTIIITFLAEKTVVTVHDLLKEEGFREGL